MTGRTPPPGAPVRVITSWPRPDVRLVRLAGELDMATVPVVRDHLRDRAGATPAFLVLDLTAVELISAAGISLLITAMRGEQGIRGRLHVVAAPGGAVRRALRLTGVDAVLPIRHHLDEVLRDVDADRPRAGGWTDGSG